MRPLRSLALIGVVLLSLGVVSWLLVASLGSDGSEQAGESATGPVGLTSPESAGELLAEEPARETRGEVPPGAPEGADVPWVQPLVRGRVVSPSGSPVVEARVLAARVETDTPVEAVAYPLYGFLEERTDGEGRFTLRMERPGPLRLGIRAGGFAPLDESIVVPAERELDLGTIVLSEALRLDGLVLDSRGQPVEGARILRPLPSSTSGLAVDGNDLAFDGAHPKGVQVAISNREGRFVWDQVPRGYWSLLVATDDHPLKHVEEELLQSEVRKLSVVVRLEDGDVLGGEVRGVPPADLESLLVQAWRILEPSGLEMPELSHLEEMRQARLDASGRFTIRGVRPGVRYRVTAGFPFRDHWLVNKTRAVEAWAGDRQVTLEYSPLAMLTFRVVDDATDLPVTDFHVGVHTPGQGQELFDENGEIKTHHPQGRVTFPRLETPKGEVGIGIVAAGYRPFFLGGIRVSKGETIDAGEIRLAPEAPLSVRVLDPEHEPVSGARVTVLRSPIFLTSERTGPTELSSESGGDGLAHFPRLLGETCRLEVVQPRYATHLSEPMEIDSLPHEPLDVVLEAGHTVEVEVLRAGGEPAPGIRVACPTAPPPDQSGRARIDPSDLSRSLKQRDGLDRTDARGRVRLEHLAPGLYLVKALPSLSNSQRGLNPSPLSDPSGWTEADARHGDAFVRIAAPEEGALRGRVTEAGTPLRDSWVLIWPEGGNSRMPTYVTTDTDGRYACFGLRPGPYSVAVIHGHRAMPFRTAARIEGEVVLDIDLPVTAVEGRVSDTAGAPIEDVHVRLEAVGDREPIIGGPRQIAATDREGWYALRGAAPGVPAMAHAKGDEVLPGSSLPFEVHAGQRLTLEPIVLVRAANLSVRISRGEGLRAARLLVRAQREGSATSQGGEQKATWLEPGEDRVRFAKLEPGEDRVRFAKLQPGRWTVTVGLGEGTEQERARRSLELLAGATSELEIDVR